MKRVIAAVRSAGEIRREERVAAGHTGAVVWIIASLSVIALALCLPAGQVHRGAVVAMGIGGCLWGAITGLCLDYRRRPVSLIHLSTATGVVAIAAAIELSGGARSPAWACLFYVVVFAAYFFKPPAAAAYFIAWASLLPDAIALVGGGSDGPADAATLAIVAPAFIVLGGAIVVGKRFLWRVRRQAERLAAEQGALRRVATAVVTGEPAGRFYAIVAVEAAQLLAAGAAAILRLDTAEQATIMGSWAQISDREYRVGNAFPLAPDSDLARALAVGRPIRVGHVEADSRLGRLGYGSSILAPIQVAGRTWGFLAVASIRVEGLTDEHEGSLTEFAGLISTAITSIEDRAALAAQASTDALTGVANHRTFHGRLTADLARARRYGTVVSVALIDVDHFKLVNDVGGQVAGDDMLIHVARCLSDATRAEDTLARVGGDEFAWILPETDAEEARTAVERARSAIVAADGQLPPVTISAGICDSHWTSDPTELVRLADRALYSSKEHGRDQVRLHAPTGTEELAAR